MPTQLKLKPYLSIIPGAIFGWLYWLAIVKALTGTVPTDNFHLTFCTIFIPPLVAPFIVNRIQRSGIGIIFSMGAIIFFGMTLTVWFLMTSSAILISQKFRHRVPSTIAYIDLGIAIGSCVFFGFLVVLLTIPGRYLSEFYLPVKPSGDHDAKSA